MPAEILLATATDAVGENLAFLSEAERQAYRDLAGNSRPLMQVAPNTVLRLLAQVTAQEQQLKVHERREVELRALSASWDEMGIAYPDYQAAAEEALAVLDNPTLDPPFHGHAHPR